MSKIAVKFFLNTDIKGGVAVTYRDKSKIFGAIDTFTQYPVLNNILVKVREKIGAGHFGYSLFTRELQVYKSYV